jgi:hypothetical protein
MPLKAKQRKALPASAFAYPSTRSYPIDTKKRARNALARAAQKGTKGSYQHVAKAVRKKWGNQVATVGKAKGTVTGPGYKKSRKSKGSKSRGSKGKLRRL